MTAADNTSTHTKTSVPVFTVCFRYPHHAGQSGYDRFADYVGQPVQLSKSVRALGESVLRLPAKLTAWYGGSFEYSRHDFVMEYQTYFHMRKHKDSIYHFMYGEKSFKLLARFAGINGHKMIATLHHPPEHYEWLFRSTDHLKALDHAVVVSTSQIEFAESILGKGRVTFVPYGVDTDYFQPAAKRDPDRPKRCLFAGTHMRDFQLLPAIMDGILDAVSDTEFVIISSDRRCEAMARRQGVTWHGTVSDAEYLDCMQQSDLLVLPLTGSTTVTTVLESLSCGTPVVTNAGGIQDYLNDECAVVLPVGDMSGMVSNTVELLRDESTRDKMRLAARRCAEKYAWPRSARRMANFYEKLSQQS